MSTPKHTYTYSRAGVGDVIVLAPEGHPYTLSASGDGWGAKYWYASDRLASVRDATKWTEFSVGTIPAAANKVVVDVLVSPTLLPNTPKFKVTVSTNNYKAAAGLQYTDSGSNRSVLDQTIQIPGSPVHHFDLTDASTLWQDTAGTIPVTADGQTVARVDNKGSSVALPIQANGPEQPLYKTGVMGGGRSACRFDGIDDNLAEASVVEAFSAGDFMSCIVVRHISGGSGGGPAWWSWDNIFGITARIEDNGPGDLGGQLGSGSLAIDNSLEACGVPEGILPIGSTIAMVGWDDGAAAQETHFSWCAGAATRAAASNGPDTAKIISIGDQNDSGNQETNADIAEIAVWPFTTGPTVAEVKAYLTLRYGVGWAQ